MQFDMLQAEENASKVKENMQIQQKKQFKGTYKEMYLISKRNTVLTER